MKTKSLIVSIILGLGLFYSCSKDSSDDSVDVSKYLPVLTTTIATEITGTVAKTGGDITSDGDSAITARGVCWSLAKNPTISDSLSITKDGTGKGAFTSTITNLKTGTTYYVRAYATNSVGTAYGQEISITTSSELSIGDSYQGGIIAYYFVEGDQGYVAGEKHGLIVAPFDQSDPLVGVSWNNSNSIQDISTGASGTAIGTGKTNTETIVNKQGDGVYAAKLCNDLVLGGYSDWYLPSVDELAAIYTNNNKLNKAKIGILKGSTFFLAYFWSSTESAHDLGNSDYNRAYTFDFASGMPMGYMKNNIHNARAVRNF